MAWLMLPATDAPAEAVSMHEKKRTARREVAAYVWCGHRSPGRCALPLQCPVTSSFTAMMRSNG